MAIKRMVLHVQTREATRAGSRGNTCRLTRVQKGSGVGLEKQRRCFDETSAYKGENNGVVYSPI
jgi:hypothetical protein